MPDNNNGLSPQDAALFLNQEWETPKGVMILSVVLELSVKFYNPKNISTAKDKYFKLSEVKPICRKMEDMTDEEIIQRDIILKEYILVGEVIAHDFKYIKWITGRGICPFPKWFKKGWVIEKVKQEA